MLSSFRGCALDGLQVPTFLPCSFSPASLPPNLLPVLSPSLLVPASSPPAPLPRLLAPASSPPPPHPRLLSLATPSPPRFLPPPPSFFSAVLNHRGLVWRLLLRRLKILLSIAAPPPPRFLPPPRLALASFPLVSPSLPPPSSRPRFLPPRLALASSSPPSFSSAVLNHRGLSERTATSDVEGVGSVRAEAAAVGMSRGWRKWRGHVAREERPMGQRRQMGESLRGYLGQA
ncbi:unnamed protein product [Closterium sp. Naga37s-1]|nr:unnamed protein product [Closterium sp. Naga37s-1]